MRIPTLLLLPLFCAFCVACGGGGGGEEGTGRTTVLSIDGPEWDGTLITEPGTMLRSTAYVMVDDAPGRSDKGYVGFFLGRLPPGVTIRSARLRLYHGATAGAPYAKLGAMYVDHLAAETHHDIMPSGGALQELLGPLSDHASEGWRGLDVTANVRGDVLAGRVHSVYRLRFWQPIAVFEDDVVDRMVFEDFESSTGGGSHPPELVVTYVP